MGASLAGPNCSSDAIHIHVAVYICMEVYKGLNREERREQNRKGVQLIIF